MIGSLPLRGMCSLHHFDIISNSRNASISPAFWRNRFLTVLVHAVDLEVGPSLLLEVTDHWYHDGSIGRVVSGDILLLFEESHLCPDVCFFMSRSPLWDLTCTSRVTAPDRTLFCSFIIISLRTSASGDLERLSFAGSTDNPFVDGFAVR